jgi:hypothetical protein
MQLTCRTLRADHLVLLVMTWFEQLIFHNLLEDNVLCGIFLHDWQWCKLQGCHYDSCFAIYSEPEMMPNRQFCFLGTADIEEDSSWVSLRQCQSTAVAIRAEPPQTGQALGLRFLQELPI